MNRPERWAIAVFALVGFAAAAAFDLFYFPAGLSFPDERRFFDSALHLLDEGVFRVSGDRAWEMPGTALIYAAFIKLFGPNAAVPAIRLFQAGLHGLQVWLAGTTARTLFDDGRAALLAAGMVALYPFFLFYQGLMLSETMFNTALLAGIATACRARTASPGRSRDGWIVAAAAILALAVWIKASPTILPPILIAAALAGLGWRTMGRAFVLAAVVYVALLSPWWLRNALVLDAFVPFTTSSATNLYLGNNPANHDGGADWETDVDRAEVDRFDAIPDEIARQHAYAQAARAFITEHPAAALRLVGLKFLRFWNVVPNAQSVRSAIFMTVSAASFGPVLVLAIAAVFLAVRQRAWQVAPLLLTVGYFTLLHSLTIASLRYRLPIEPLLIILAAWPMSLALDRLNR